MDITQYLHTLSSNTLKQGSILFSEGDQDDPSMFVIMEGQVNVYTGFRTENRVKVNEIKPGDFLGEMALIKNMPRSATAVVVTPHARIAKIDRTVFLSISKQSPDFLFDLLKTVLDRLIIAEMKIKKLTGSGL